MSELNELAKALCEAQVEMQDAVRNADNPFFNSKYADLESVLKASRPVLHKHGLSVFQGTDFDEHGPFLVTRLMHVSGQSLVSRTPLLFEKRNAQGLKAAITLTRRAAYTAAIGSAEFDSDGNESIHTPQKHTNEFVAPHKPRDEEPFPTDADFPFGANEPEPQKPHTQMKGKYVSEKQISRLFALGRPRGWDKSNLTKYAQEVYGVSALELLPWQKIQEFFNTVELKTFEEAIG